MEKNSDLELDWFKEYFVYTTKKVDYAIDSVYSSGNNKTICRLKRVELFPMPVEIRVSFSNGKNTRFYIPLNLMMGSKQFIDTNPIQQLKEWSWVNPYYEFEINNNFNEIKEITLNPDNQLMDVNPLNDVYKITK